MLLATTPGIPIEWVYALGGIGPKARKGLTNMIDAADPAEGQVLAESLLPGDGLKMIAAVCPDYAGAAPLWTQLDLKNDKRSAAAIARELGVHPKKVWRWRRNVIFDPLTGVRLVAARGRTRAL
ncbi:hypothetical protein [Sphingomonas jaspsi]|uniref:hypothetical protein n=1 Tax=Sphingomonas jaspsi TaxID=392409 RepID=UPI0004B599D2|nr:hypothetical protein [Sphingomonas jaspsi]